MIEEIQLRGATTLKEIDDPLRLRGVVGGNSCHGLGRPRRRTNPAMPQGSKGHRPHPRGSPREEMASGDVERIEFHRVHVTAVSSRQ